MKNNKYMLNTLLAVALFVTMGIMMLMRVYYPIVILPRLDIPNMALLSLIVLVAEYYLAPGSERCYICIPVLAAVTFGLLPLMAGFACVHDFWKIGLAGGAVFTATTWLFTSMTDRIGSGEKAVAAPILSVLGLYLAVQGFMGIFL